MYLVIFVISQVAAIFSVSPQVDFDAAEAKLIENSANAKAEKLSVSISFMVALSDLHSAQCSKPLS